MTDAHKPPMDPNTSEATERQLEFARAQGEAFGKALEHMTQQVANDGGEQPAGEYLVGYAVEEAEGMYQLSGGELVWHEPGSANAHLEISVRDGADGRFVPGLRVVATLVDPEGNEVGTHEQPMLWHPMIYHYGRNWELPADGEYVLRVHIDPPTFHRHDEVNGKRFAAPVDVEFRGVKVERGQG